MTKQLIVVGGLGDYGTNLVRPCKDYLIERDYISGITIVDTPEGYSRLNKQKLDELALENINVVQRPKNFNLSEIINEINYREPLVLLGHPNELHTPDAIDLIENSSKNTKLLIEKPYAINNSQINNLEKLIEKYLGRIALPEYGIALKGVPILMVQGKIKEDSFYFKDKRIIRELSKDGLEILSGKFYELIRDVESIESFYCEGKGSMGVIGNRTLSLVDKNQGGGMIQDLFHHAIVFIGDSFGDLKDYKIKDVKLGFCNEYVNKFKDKVGLENLGESSARISLISPKKIPVIIYIGKYTPKDSNLRFCRINGTKGSLVQDMLGGTLWHIKQNIEKPLLQDNSKNNFSEYSIIFRSSMEYLKGNNPYNFDPVNHLLGAQKLILDILNTKPSQIRYHDKGEDPKEIFK